jgi:uncharacterized membrane protein
MFRNALALLVGIVLLTLGFMFSVIILAVVAVLGLGVWGYVWWKTRKLRQAMREKNPDGQIIEGETLIVEEYRADAKNTLPEEPPRQ